MIGPKCECGQHALPSGEDWVCGNPGCAGFRQICRPMTVEEKRQQTDNYLRQSAAAGEITEEMRRRVQSHPGVDFVIGDAVFMKGLDD